MPRKSEKATPKGVGDVIQKAIETYAKDYPGAARLSFVVRRAEPRSWYTNDGEPSGSKGSYYPGGRVVIVSAAVDSLRDVYETIQHEVIAHAGLGTLNQSDRQEILATSDGGGYVNIRLGLSLTTGVALPS